ncbi:MAG: hypothetical protein L0Z50_38710 [Verrucomicrobiales bacterium]|nr:hypothetical protein [Verrucomicrobiales bacterium]
MPKSLQKTVCHPIVIALATACSLEGASNFVPAHSLSWGANIGWLNWRGNVENGVVIDQFVCSGYIYSANIGWINMGNGAPLDRLSYRNNSATDFGVNVTENGDLRGLAYGANIGWINFAPVGQPRIDLSTGRLSGFVYGANVGWISLGDSVAVLEIESLGEGNDSDLDGIPDAWEIAHATNLTSLTENGDLDADGYSDRDEYGADTDPMDLSDNLRILKFSLAGNRSSATLTWSTRLTRRYVLETRSNLAGMDQWKDAGFGTLSASGPNISRDVPQNPDIAQQYFRIRATRPLAP